VEEHKPKGCVVLKIIHLSHSKEQKMLGWSKKSEGEPSKKHTVNTIYPRRIVVVSPIIDYSGSFAGFIPAAETITKHAKKAVLESVGEKGAKYVYMHACDFNDENIISKFANIVEHKQASRKPQGSNTFLGKAFADFTAARRASRTEVMENESSIKEEHCLLFSDLFSAGETEEIVQNGVSDLESYCKEFKVKLQLLLPKNRFHTEIASRFESAGATIQMLEDVNPLNLLQIIVDFVTNASRKAI
jgi:hypothetical protein